MRPALEEVKQQTKTDIHNMTFGQIGEEFDRVDDFMGRLDERLWVFEEAKIRKETHEDFHGKPIRSDTVFWCLVCVVMGLTIGAYFLTSRLAALENALAPL